MKRISVLPCAAPYNCILVMILLAWFLLPCAVHAELVDKVVAVVNDDIITLSELEEATESLYATVAKQAGEENLLQAMAEAREATLDKLIDQKIIRQRAKKLGVNVSTDEIDNAYEKTRNKLVLSQSEFIEKLESSGLTEESYRTDLEAKILQSKVLSYDVRSKIVVTDEMVREYYDANYISEVEEGNYYLLQIGFKWNTAPEKIEESKARSLKTAKRVLALAKSGQDFKTLAKKFSEFPSASDGGDIGLFTLDDMALPMRQAIEPLKFGEISELVETSAGYQFFKLISGEDGASVSSAAYDIVKEEIKEQLYDEKLQNAFEEWVKNLKDKAYIQKL